MADDELQVLLSSLADHRAMVHGASRVNPDVDLAGALEAHARLATIMTRWAEFSAPEQREIVRTIAYLVDAEDDEPDLRSPYGFRDDLAQIHRLRAFLGYV